MFFDEHNTADCTLIAGAVQSLRLSEQTRERLDEEIRSLNRDRSELMEQISVANRQKSALAEELINARKESEKHSDAVLRLAKAKEELTKEKAELAVQITACERENRQQGEASIFVLPYIVCPLSAVLSYNE